MNTPFGNSITTAEHAITLMLSLARQIPEADASTRAGKWEKNKFLGVEIFGKTLGVIGCGNIGAIVAERAIGMKMKVIAYDPYLSDQRALDLGVEKVELEELLRRADFLTLHTPLTDKTRNIINAEALKLTKKSLRLINCARGGLIDEAALFEALVSGRIAGAALDVFGTEPATDSPLFKLPNVVCTPHLGASTTEAQENVALQIAEQMSDYLIRGAAAQAVHRAGGEARLVCRPAHRDRSPARADFLRGHRRADEHTGADLGGDRGTASPHAARRQRRLGADRGQGPRHRRRGDKARCRGRL
jgi:D-3-phosphoglycerate dehydrogenase